MVRVVRRRYRTDQRRVVAVGISAGAVLPIPLLAIHGAIDNVIAPADTIALVRQYLCFNGHPAASAKRDSPAELPRADSERTERAAAIRP
jgi:hypothetical protein